MLIVNLFTSTDWFYKQLIYKWISLNHDFSFPKYLCNFKILNNEYSVQRTFTNTLYFSQVFSFFKKKFNYT